MTLDGPPMAGSEEWEHARALVMRHGWNAVAYQILNPGITLWFSDAGDGVVGYVAYAGVRVVAGAPACAAERLADVTAEFEGDAARAGERVCYFGAGERLERIHAHSPRHAKVLLGGQPVWNPGEWPQVVSGKASIRAQLNRARNKGVVVVEWPSATAHEHPALLAVLHGWLATRGLPTLHFLVEPETLGRVADRRVFVAERGGTVVGFVVATPVPARDGWLIEQWPRARSAPNGTVDLLVDSAMCALGAAGARYVTLGLSPLSRHAELPAPARHPRWLSLVLRLVRAHGRRFYNFDGLDAFKAKFEPDHWEPVYAIAVGPRFTPRMLYAVAGAFSNGSPVALVARAAISAAGHELRYLAARRGSTG